MFCPEDGTRIEPYDPSKLGSAQPYPPCSTCGTRYVYLSELGRYEVAEGASFKELYEPYCICEPGEPDEACPVDGYGIFMRRKEYYDEGRRDEVPASPGHEGGCH